MAGYILFLGMLGHWRYTGDGDSCVDTGNSSLCVEPGVEGVTHLVGEPWAPSQFSCARSCFITLVFFLQFVNNTYIQKMIMF